MCAHQPGAQPTRHQLWHAHTRLHRCQTGLYIFTVTSDDASAVYLSPNAESQHKQLICSVPGNTLATEFDKFITQVSQPVQLVAGAHYYVELLHKEGSANDHFALYWQTPSNSNREVVPGTALVQWADCTPGAEAARLPFGADGCRRKPDARRPPRCRTGSTR
ncbi:MAG: hypothetical protein IPJ85_16880 [Flavobacteriales bacterium]|nr:hypothetical protein [Flavobacteriales bacterium]